MMLIKNIDKYTIELREGNGYEFNLQNFYKGTFIITIVSIIIAILFEYEGKDYSIYYGLGVWIFFVLMCFLMDIYDDIIPSYIVSSDYYPISGIYVKKENPGK